MDKQFRVITITSTRPCLLRQSIIIKKLDELLGKNHIHIYTGQNYDENLYHIFLKDLSLRTPDYQFNLREQVSGIEFINQCMINVKEVLKDYDPKHTKINILGDVNGSFASAYVAKRMGFRIYHSEGGNRCHRDIPEEINRKCIDTLSHKLLPYTNVSKENLLQEGYNRQDIIVIGNPLSEVLQGHISETKDKLIGSKYILASIHRYENINNLDTLINIIKAIRKIAQKHKIIFSVHPSLNEKIQSIPKIKQLFEHKNIQLHTPFNYTDYICLMKHSICVIEDSGGVPEESALLNVPCILVRNETERNELLEQSQMIMSGTKTEDIIRAFKTIQSKKLKGIPTEYTKPTSDIVVGILMGGI